MSSASSWSGSACCNPLPPHAIWRAASGRAVSNRASVRSRRANSWQLTLDGWQLSLRFQISTVTEIEHWKLNWQVSTVNCQLRWRDPGQQSGGDFADRLRQLLRFEQRELDAGVDGHRGQHLVRFAADGQDAMTIIE